MRGAGRHDCSPAAAMLPLRVTEWLAVPAGRVQPLSGRSATHRAAAACITAAAALAALAALTTLTTPTAPSAEPAALALASRWPAATSYPGGQWPELRPVARPRTLLMLHRPALLPLQRRPVRRHGRLCAGRRCGRIRLRPSRAALTANGLHRDRRPQLRARRPS